MTKQLGEACTERPALSGVLGTVPDHRCPGLPDVPHSSFCRVCWYPVYSLWISEDDHSGKCPHGHTQAHECQEAKGRAELAAAVRRLKVPND